MELEQQAKFDLLVRQLERSARQKKPNNYQLRVAALTAIGYGYIGAIFGLICLGLAIGLWLVRGLVEFTQHRTMPIDPERWWMLCGFLAIVVFSAQSTPLKDREIHRTEFPELFTTIDRLRARLNAPPIHHVVINYEHNAAVYQSPRLGWLGWDCNYLLLGLPLMQSLTPEQFEATLAHELGHLSSNDNRFMGSVLRVRQIWEQIAADRNLFIFQWFFRWYEPLIKAYSFVLVRDREYAADALAKRMTSPAVTASDLIQTYIYQHYLQEWFDLQLDPQAGDLDLPPANVVTQMLAALRKPLDPQVAKIWLDLILAEATDTDDTHPCLSDRLAAVGCPTPKSWTPQPILHTAAEHFFGDRLVDLAAELDLQWCEHRQAAWQERHHQIRYRREYLADLHLQATTRSLTLCEATSQAELTTELHDESLALPLWQEILARYPEHPQANYRVGKILVNRGHWSGCAYLERAIALDPDLVISSCEELYKFHISQGDLASAEIYLAWRQQHLPKQWRSKLERKIKDTDRFIHHNLEMDLVSEIRDKLINYALVDRAYLVCKPMQVFADTPIYLLVIKLNNLQSADRQKHWANLIAARELCDRLQIELNFGDRLVITSFNNRQSLFADRQDRRLLKKVEQHPHTTIL